MFTFQWVVKEVQECCVCYQCLDGIRFLIDGYIVIVQWDEVTSLFYGFGSVVSRIRTTVFIHTAREYIAINFP